LDEAIASRLVEGVDYYTIGNSKSLSKAGAEGLCSRYGGLFPTQPQFEIIDKIEDWEKGLFSYTFKCTLYDGSGTVVGEGVGTASTFEPKRRYIWLTKRQAEQQGRSIEGCAKERRYNRKTKSYYDVYRVPLTVEELIAKRNETMKMAKKSSFTDATLNATGASRSFTQDLDELIANRVFVPEESETGQSEPTPEPEPEKPKSASLLKQLTEEPGPQPIGKISMPELNQILRELKQRQIANSELILWLKRKGYIPKGGELADLDREHIQEVWDWIGEHGTD